MKEESTVKISIQIYFAFNSNNNYFILIYVKYIHIYIHYSSTGIDVLFKEIILIFVGVIVEF